ncbi:hypothetical protein XENTR_v10006451 [Xenopus tropicalis]|nr:hypothetical protein XENTR_v10006451 [Xenopus tropicalis]
MPFYDNVYYPFDSDNASSSPSILSSPCLPPYATRKLPSGAGTMFKFRTRHESMDWRRIGAIDVEKVANELDFITLQENVMSITFCNLQDEKCPHCKNSLDPILLKLFRLSQFTIEYLLHSQEYLTSSLRSMEEEAQAAIKEAEQIKLKMAKQSEDIKSLKDECKRRKKMIASQQMMISAGAGAYHKCNFCDKAFVNYSFLQSHIHRRHPQSAESEKTKQQANELLQNEISKLKNELQHTKCQLETERCAQIEKLSKFQEMDCQKSFEQEMLKKFNSWKEEEKEKHAEEIAKVKDKLQKEVTELAVKNASLGKVKEQSIKLTPPVATYSEIVQAPTPLSHHSEIKPNASLLSDVEAEVPSLQKTHALTKNQSLAKELRPVFEEGLAEKLESLGVKQGARGIPSDQCKKMLDSVKCYRAEREKQMPAYRQIRQNLISDLILKAEERTSPTVGKLGSTPQALRKGSISSFLHPKSEASVLKSSQESYLSDQKSFASLKQTKAKVKVVLSKDMSAKKPPCVKTPPFTSDDESSADGGPMLTCNTTDSLKMKLPHNTKGSVGFVESESDSEGSFLEELHPQWVSKPNVQKQAPVTTAPATMVKELSKQIEKEALLHSVKNKPVGGVDVRYGFASSKDEVMELKVADIDDNEFDNSSTDEEHFEVPRLVKSRPVVKKVKNGHTAAPVRNTFVSRLAKEDVREMDTSSTLVSSLVTVSDFSDSSDT